MMVGDVPVTIQAWLEQLSDSIPIKAAKESSILSSPRSLIQSHSSIRGTLVEAMLWLRVGLIDPAHSIVQDGRNDLERYIHGVVHRLEGDFWNAKYWFRQVRDASLNQRIAKALGESPLASEAAIGAKGLFDDLEKTFGASQFVDQIERIVTSQDQDRTILKFVNQIAQAEWDALWQEVL